MSLEFQGSHQGPKRLSRSHQPLGGASSVDSITIDRSGLLKNTARSFPCQIRRPRPSFPGPAPRASSPSKEPGQADKAADRIDAQVSRSEVGIGDMVIHGFYIDGPRSTGATVNADTRLGGEFQ